jgi:hypothetical protein
MTSQVIVGRSLKVSEDPKFEAMGGVLIGATISTGRAAAATTMALVPTMWVKVRSTLMAASVRR